MKVTFLDLPNFLGRQNVERVFGCTYTLYPMPNIFSLLNAAIIRDSGIKVRYIDMANEGWKLKKFTRFINNDDSDAYVFHSVNLSVKSDIFAHSLIRREKPSVALIYTGPAPTYFTGSFLTDNNTFVVRGESDYTLRDLVLRLENRQKVFGGLNGISYLDGGNIINNPMRPLIDDLDALPFPARDLLNNNLYYNPKLDRRPFTAMQTSRNCSYRCSFCVPNSFNFARELEHKKFNANLKPPVRVRSAANVIQEFRLLKDQGYKAVSIIDDQFLWQEERTVSICRGIRELGIEWGCLARADHISDKIAEELRLAGLKYIDLGIESFNQNVLNDVCKDLDVERAYQAIDILKSRGILVKINLILGISPLQDKAVILDDIARARKIGVDAVMFSIATPFPGTVFFERAKLNRWIVNKEYRPESVQSKAIIDYPGLTHKELDSLVRKANLSFYFAPKFILKNIKRIFSPLSLYRGILALKRKFL
ncbi:MAG: radical SAM protein [Candidatus Omnitrophota bacterium]|jgi:radical SAM superfamily enzyme YgiQ (UPF0313 family)|nr:MAG: radical SAM protein [Candidatus Omnitrophota bacterium]